MILFPAIDLKAGQCVRLVQGDIAQPVIFNDDPIAQAEQFAAQGFTHLHVVDLDGAFAGGSRNGTAISAIRDAVELRIQVGGGIRSMEDIDAWLQAGIDRVILGTLAVRDPELIRTACRVHPDKIIVGIDARDGVVAVEGWSTHTELGVVELANRFADAGVAAIIYTDIGRDGLLTGLNIDATLALANAVPIPVIASGGLASLDDVDRLLAPDCALLEGAIAGRALYDGRLDPAVALGRIATHARHWVGKYA